MRLGRLFGVRIVLNNFFLLTLAGFGTIGLLPQALLLFAAVLAHELAHVVVARGMGLTVESVELLPFGGVARLADFLELDPEAERSVALAGPVTNLFLAALAAALRAYRLGSPEHVTFFLQTNLVLAAFNCVPALPLDGGRILRSCLVRRWGFRRATEVAADLGRAIAVLFAAVGVVGLYLRYLNLSLLILAFFVYAAASKERENAAWLLTRYLARKQRELRERQVLPVETLVAGEHLPVREVVRRFVPQRYHLIYLVGESGDVSALVTEAEVIAALLAQGSDVPLRDLARRHL
ncbi:MAG: M50 family metallopeptidase [Bacillota bacterium]|nr:M50 family metallopeptidase [Bacillota bacterium]